jgi:hypothetical protein
MTTPVPGRLRCERGQASIEATASLPLLLVAGLIAWQLALAGDTAWLCAHAARAAARAEAVGRDPAAAARSALPRSLEQGLSVQRRGGGAVRVGIRVPLLLRRIRTPVRVAATAALAPPPGPNRGQSG